MAEAENGDPYLQNLKIQPARQIRREAGANGRVQDRRKRGFNKLFVVVTEGITFCFLKSCLLNIFCILTQKKQVKKKQNTGAYGSS